MIRSPLAGLRFAQRPGMRLVLRSETFAIHDVPRGVDPSDLPRAYWNRRERTLRAHVRDAPAIPTALARHRVRLTDDEVRAAAARALEEDLIDGSEGLGAFGDARALPELSRALDGFQHLDCAVSTSSPCRPSRTRS
jgi:hypothetical protein